MMQEDEELLLKDLCGRLPYGVKVETPYAKEALFLGIIERKGYNRGIRYVDVITDKQTYPIRYIKPYLRPLSSITEEEKLELSTVLIYANMIDNTRAQIDWFNEHYIDYRGLIPKGLAISTEEFNPYKE